LYLRVFCRDVNSFGQADIPGILWNQSVLFNPNLVWRLRFVCGIFLCIFLADSSGLSAFREYQQLTCMPGEPPVKRNVRRRQVESVSSGCESLEPRLPLAVVTIQATSAGRTPDALGYNLGHFMPGTNAADWFNYSGVTAARAFISPSDIEPSDDLPGIGDGVVDQATFMARRSALRANAANPAAPLDNSFINWPAFRDR
jgi:hypothetical protein